MSSESLRVVPVGGGSEARTQIEMHYPYAKYPTKAKQEAKKEEKVAP